MLKELEQESAFRAKPAPSSPRHFKYNVLDIQNHTKTQSMALGKKGKVDLINLNHRVNSWHLLRIKWPRSGQVKYYHLESADRRQEVRLDANYKTGVVIVGADGRMHHCDLWGQEAGYPLRVAQVRQKPFATMCNKRLFLRNRIEGYRTTKEWVVEFLRDNVWGGETITSLVKKSFYKDKFLKTSAVMGEKGPEKSAGGDRAQTGGPRPGLIDKEFADSHLDGSFTGLPIAGEQKEMRPGHWYRVRRTRGLYASVIQPRLLPGKIRRSHKDYVKKLDKVELKAMIYLVAMDLDVLDLGFALGTEHPRVVWSSRALPAVVNDEDPGPDRIGSYYPLASPGLLNPIESQKIAATFTGGFKRSHGAFKWGSRAKKRKGHHYGFIENGVTFSSLQPGLGTILITVDGEVHMRTWKAGDQKKFVIRHARQNGVPLVTWSGEKEEPVPGRFVSNWMLGNWSGSEDQKFRTLRAGLCYQKNSDKRFLIYGYFSSVTPTAMARVFQAYNCRYAMHLDMNALEHTYFAAYPVGKKGGKEPRHLVRGMKVLDQRFKGNVPRFIGYPDNRDFFYLTYKKKGGE